MSRKRARQPENIWKKGDFSPTPFPFDTLRSGCYRSQINHCAPSLTGGASRPETPDSERVNNPNLATLGRMQFALYDGGDKWAFVPSSAPLCCLVTTFLYSEPCLTLLDGERSAGGPDHLLKKCKQTGGHWWAGVTLRQPHAAAEPQRVQVAGRPRI